MTVVVANRFSFGRVLQYVASHCSADTREGEELVEQLKVLVVVGTGVHVQLHLPLVCVLVCDCTGARFVVDCGRPPCAVCGSVCVLLLLSWRQ